MCHYTTPSGRGGGRIDIKTSQICFHTKNHLLYEKNPHKKNINKYPYIKYYMVYYIVYTTALIFLHYFL